MLSCAPAPSSRNRPATGHASPATKLHLHDRRTPGRAAVEDFIRGVYRQRYGADVQHFAPMLVSLQDEDGVVVAAAGYRAANIEPLFLERYLDAPIETRLGETSLVAPQRDRIVEVGHLAASRAGQGQRLILLLGPHLARQGFQWVVATLTQELRHLFVRMGIAPMALGVADPALLGDAAESWGSYYDHRPVVLAGQLSVALQAQARRHSLA
jgi:hypothetical protein